MEDLIFDLWQYATGKEWEDMTEEAAAESETLHSLYLRVEECIGGQP